MGIKDCIVDETECIEGVIVYVDGFRSIVSMT
jgi:hypothetical protein